jgi:predicted nucleic acid-binding protein
MTCFIDTNILLYSVSIHPEEFEKQQISTAILKREKCVFSVQVFQEFYVQATRPSRARPASHAEALGLIEAWWRYPVQDMTLDVFRLALELKEQFRFSYWDCAIVAAASVAKCRVLYTEDLQHGQIINGIKVVNPFAG